MGEPFWLVTQTVQEDLSVQSSPIKWQALTGVLFSPWDVCTLSPGPAGTTSDQLPGQSRVAAAQLKIREDTRKQPGFNGAPIKPLGVIPGVIDLSVRTWSPEQWDQLQLWIEYLWGSTVDKWSGATALRKGKQMTPAQAAAIMPALKIHHPSLVSSRIDKVVVVGYTPPAPESANSQVMVTHFQLKQWTQDQKVSHSQIRAAPEKPIAPQFIPPGNFAGDPPSKTKTGRR